MKKLVFLYSVILLEICLLCVISVIESGNPINFQNESRNENKEGIIDNNKSVRESKSKNYIYDVEKESGIVEEKGSEKAIDFKTDDEIMKKLDKLNNDEGVNNEEIEDVLKEEAISVFKVDCSSIKGDLTFGDKKEMLKVATKLDFSLFGKIKDLLYHENQEYGVLKALLLLKENLSDEDYEIVREVSNRFVDLEKVDEYYYLEQSGAVYQ